MIFPELTNPEISWFSTVVCTQQMCWNVTWSWCWFWSQSSVTL